MVIKLVLKKIFYLFFDAMVGGVLLVFLSANAVTEIQGNSPQRAR